MLRTIISRAVYSNLAALCFVALVALDQPRVFEPHTSAVIASLQRAVFEKEFTFFGLNVLTQQEVAARLPHDRSVFWWLLNRAKVSRSLSRHPYIADADVVPCNRFIAGAWGCFLINVKERKPSLIAAVADRAWIVGDDGSFIAPARSAADLERAFPEDQREGREPVVVAGLFAEHASPEVVKARADYVHRALKVIEERSGLTVHSVEMKESAELQVRFSGLPLSARFDFSQNDLDRLGLEAERLKRVLKEFGGRQGEIKEVDLAFNKVAVVRVTE